MAAIGINPAAPNQQPALAPIENPRDREIVALTKDCMDKDVENGKFGSKLIVVATLVAAIAALFLIEGILGYLLFAGMFFLGGDLASQAYHKLRNHDFLDAANALGTRSFKEFIIRNEVNPTIDNILVIHKQYKTHAIEQAERLPRQL